MSVSTYVLLTRALFLKKTLGIKSAAGFLRNREVPVELAARALARDPKYVRPLSLRLTLV